MLDNSETGVEKIKMSKAIENYVFVSEVCI